MRTGPTLIVVAIALAAGGFAGYRLALPKPDPALPSVAVDGQKTAKKLLYYRNPMGLPDTSPVPKKDPMGMDYLPVYEGEDEAESGLKISPEKVQKLGVRTAAAKMQMLDRSVRASGRVEIDESLLVASEKQMVEEALKKHSYNISLAAAELGRDRLLFNARAAIERHQSRQEEGTPCNSE